MTVSHLHCILNPWHCVALQNCIQFWHVIISLMKSVQCPWFIWNGWSLEELVEYWEYGVSQESSFVYLNFNATQSQSITKFYLTSLYIYVCGAYLANRQIHLFVPGSMKWILAFLSVSLLAGLIVAQVRFFFYVFLFSCMILYFVIFISYISRLKKKTPLVAIL